MKISFSPTLLLYLIFALGLGEWKRAIAYILTVFMHEVTHYAVATKRGYLCQRLEISLCGAVLYGDFEVMGRRDELFVALSAPLLNAVVALGFTALWWIFPISYVWTEELVFANFGMAFCNLFPCYPLDGGRAVFAVMRAKFGGKKAFSVIRRNNVVFGVISAVIFAVTAFSGKVNFSAGMFGLCLLWDGTLGKQIKNVYCRKTFCDYKEKLLKGAETAILSFDSSVSLYSAYKECGFGKLWLIDIYSSGKKAVTVTVFELEKALFSAPAGTKLDVFLSESNERRH